jgi:hypothetical protein
MLKNYCLTLGVLILLTFFLLYFTNHYILTAGFYENSFEPLSGIPGNSLKIYDSLQTWIYLASAVYLLIKLGVISLILYTAIYLTDEQVQFKDIFKITILAEFIFLIPALIKTISFPIVFPNGTLSDWNRYYILSAISLVNTAPADWNYALQTLNVFEVCYWFLLAFGIYKMSALDFDRSLRMVLVAYMPALFIWVAFVTFCTLMLFPGFG